MYVKLERTISCFLCTCKYTTINDTLYKNKNAANTRSIIMAKSGLIIEQFAVIIPSRLHLALAGVIDERLEHMQSILRAFCVVVVLNAVNLDALICTGE